MTPGPRIRYFLVLPSATEPTTLEAAEVLPWLKGFAAARGQGGVLDQIDNDAAEDTRRVQGLQIGHAAGWFRYMYQERDESRDES